MAAVNKVSPATGSERPSTGSWDDLMRHSRRKDSLGQAIYDKDTGRRPRSRSTSRPESTTHEATARAHPRSQVIERPSSPGADFAVEGRTHSSSPVRRPVKPRTMFYHSDQRDSSGFSTQMAATHGNSSPLRTVRTLKSSDSMPELHIGASSEMNNYTTDRQQDHHSKPSKRPGRYARPSRLSESISMSDLEAAQITPDLPLFNTKAKARGHMRAKSWHGKQPPIEPNPFQIPPLPNVPLEIPGFGLQDRIHVSKHVRTRKPGPNVLFNKLPGEVLRMIMGQLKKLHLENSSSCATCWMRDCCSVSLSNKKWLKTSRDILYEDIQLAGPEGANQRKKYKGVYCTRLVLLRRTLRSDQKLAAVVRFLKVPALSDEAPIETRGYHDIVASLVMACPNLERLDGFYPSYNHSESRLFNALSSRTRLQEMTWILDAAESESEENRDHKKKSSKSWSRHSRHQSFISTTSSTLTTPKFLPAALANKFVRHHMDWLQLKHLTIHCLPGAQLNTPNGLLNVTQSYLDSLQSLHLSHVPPSAFDDTTLAALPKPLKQLTLSHCVGVTTAGLSNFATTASAQHLETLTLVHQNLDTLPAVVRLFANLSNLTKFSLVQAQAPTMPDDELIWLMPYVSSRSVRYLHWDVFDSTMKDRNGDMPGTKADDILARSIAAGGFPGLRFLRVPCDPDGKFQALCRPKERIDLPGDRYRNGHATQASTGAIRSTARDQAGHASLNTTIIKPYASSGTLGPYSSSAISLLLPQSEPSESRPSSSLSSHSVPKTLPVHEAGSNLHNARLLAQARLEAARGFPLFEANITNEEGTVIESTGLAGFLGDIKSKILYTLAPDAGGIDERGGLVGILDLLNDGGEDLYGKGDAASRSGAGFGTGCVASEHAAAQALGDEAAERGGLSQGKGKSKSKSRSKSRSKSKERRAKITKEKTNKGLHVDQEKMKVRDGCMGRWNSYNGENFTMDRTIGDRWEHAERGRWRGRVKLS